MLLRELIKKGTDRLKACGIDKGENDARLLAMYVFNLDYTELFMELQKSVGDKELVRYNELIEKRATHYPLQYITGTQDFMGYTFLVGENVLIPRPETELLVEKALKLTENRNPCNVLDMCCGTGCIGISYILERRKKGYMEDKLTLVDISSYAVELSEKNSFLHGVCCDIIKSDMFEYRNSTFSDGKHGKDLYDIIVTNPPYIKSEAIESLMEEVKLYEPHLALDGYSDGLYFYREIIKEAGKHLNENGCFICEIGYDQYNEVYRILVDNGYNNIELIRDLSGLDRIVSACI